MSLLRAIYLLWSNVCIFELKRSTLQQKSIRDFLTSAKNSVAGFKIREGMPLGLTVTLRREKKYAFLEKFIKLVLPRIRDFRGLNPKNFDKFGNYNLGISDQLVFPEIDYDSVEQRRGFNITIVTTAKNKEEAFYLLQELGFPFAKAQTSDT